MPTLSENEREQLLETCRMFESLTESNPDDYESLRYLMDAYRLLGDQDKVVITHRKLFSAFLNLGLTNEAREEMEKFYSEYPSERVVRLLVLENHPGG